MSTNELPPNVTEEQVGLFRLRLTLFCLPTGGTYYRFEVFDDDTQYVMRGEFELGGRVDIDWVRQTRWYTPGEFECYAALLYHIAQHAAGKCKG